MLDRSDPKLLRALISLSNQPEWKTLDAELVSELATATDKLIDAGGDLSLIGKWQGRAKFIQQFRALVAQAPGKLSALQPHKL